MGPRGAIDWYGSIEKLFSHPGLRLFGCGDVVCFRGAKQLRFARLKDSDEIRTTEHGTATASPSNISLMLDGAASLREPLRPDVESVPLDTRYPRIAGPRTAGESLMKMLTERSDLP